MMQPLATRRPLTMIATSLVLAAAACSSDGTVEASEPLVTSDIGVGNEAVLTDETTAEPGTSEPESSESEVSEADAEELFPDVIDATAERSDDGTWRISATLSSPYDSPERYADAWQVLGPDGTAYGERFLTHDHANEQPFTRTESGIEIPDDVDVVTIQGRDQVSGWGGQTFELILTR